MWFGWFVASALAQAPTCVKVSGAEIAAVDAPAVIVLGERRGIWPDLLRAERLVNRLHARGPVTVALQSVRVEHQPILDQLMAHSIGLRDVPALTDWTNTWGIPWPSYEGLVSTGEVGVKLVAIGVDDQPRPADTPIPMPPGYLHVLLDAVGEHALPVDLEDDFVQLMAWKDHRMAQAAISQWDGQGVLVIVVDRLHVEGGLGVAWQAQRLTDRPVSAALLADGQSPCYANDRIWREHPLDR